MSRPTGGFRRSDRLLESRDFRRVSRSGKRFASPDFVVLVAPAAKVGRLAGGSTSGRRLGVTASRKVGNAVVRNRVKRAIRSWFRLHREELAGDVDVVVIARRSAADLDAVEIERRLCRLLGLPSEERDR